MKRTSNPNPLIEEIMQAYLKTHMTEQQFEKLVESAVTGTGGVPDPKVLQERYDKGFSDGYDSALSESVNTSTPVPLSPYEDA